MIGSGGSGVCVHCVTFKHHDRVVFPHFTAVLHGVDPRRYSTYQPWISTYSIGTGQRGPADPTPGPSKLPVELVFSFPSNELSREIRQPHLGVDGWQRQRKVTIGGRQQSTLSNRRHSQFHPSTTVSQTILFKKLLTILYPNGYPPRVPVCNGIRPS